ncbi:MAG: hypothetical protein VX473_07360 [Candidatus Thermoplasmatota archaeon]|nr:hypothetical protein [Candidatus Thermoplasmatota archaeon]
MTGSRVRTTWFILGLLLLSSSAPTISADPGDEEVVNTICQTWNSTSGICDDYNFADDETASMEWIEGRYNVNMANATIMTLTLEWAIHEVRRDDVMLEDLPLGNGSDASTDGIPADYLRNYLDYVTLSGSTVRDSLLNSVSTTVTSLIDNGFGTTSGVQTSYVNQITLEDQAIQCTDDRDQDSADEVAGLPNDAYNPPICLKTTLSISIDPSELGMTEVGMDVERAYQGLLTMGGMVRTDMNLTALPGHMASYEFEPPSYGNIINVSGDGDLVPTTFGGYDYNFGRWNVNHKDATDDSWKNESASVTMIRRSTTTKAVEIDIGNERGVDVEILVDASEERATSVEIKMGINYIAMDTLNNWEWEFADDRVSVPWVTADGLRLAHHSGLANLTDFADKVPVSELNDLIADRSPIDIEFEPFEFSSPDGLGGLDFVHQPGVTCSEPSPSNWCVLGNTAMNGTYPVYLSTHSNTFDMDFGSIVNTLADEFDIDLLGFDPSLITQEDRAAILNGIMLSREIKSPSLVDWMGDELPQADVTLEIILPDYVRSTEGNPERIVLTHTIGQPENHTISITGAQPYDWRHPICQESNCGDDSLDLVCGANQRTCMALNLDIEFSDLNVNEWSKSVEISAGGNMEFSLYRIGVPESVLSEVPNLGIEAVPADLIRRFVHLGNQMEGGLLAPLEDSLTVPFEGEEIPLVLTEEGLNDFASEIGNIVENNVNENLQDALDEINQGGEVFLKDPGEISISVSIDGLEKSPTPVLSDLRPIRVFVEVSKTNIHVEYVGELGGDDNLATTGMNLWTNSLLAASDGGNGIEVPPGEDIVIDIPAPAFEIEDEIISPLVRLKITLPWGIGFSNFQSEMGRGEISDEGGSGVLTYYVPLCREDTVEACEEQSDTVSFRVIVGFDFIFQQLLGYIVLIVGLLILFIIRRRNRKRRKREKKAKEESDIVGHRMSDLQVLNDGSYGDDGLPDMGNFAGLDKKGNIPGESWEDEFDF